MTPAQSPEGSGLLGRQVGHYQTVYARHDGAVGAPTAGLHFTAGSLAALTRRGIGAAYVTLHVGAGTFIPVKVDDTEDHHMHGESGSLPADTAAAINAARAAGGRVASMSSIGGQLPTIRLRPHSLA